MGAHPLSLISPLWGLLKSMEPSEPNILPEPSRLSLPMLPTTGRARRPPRPGQGEKFLKGPIPWSWRTKAARLPGKTLAVAIAVYFLAGLTKSSTVKLGLSNLEAEMGVKRDAAARGLAALEAAGLVGVERHVGRKPRVTILPQP